MIFLVLGSLRTVLVPIVAIPVSLIGAVFLMQLFGFTINLLTLLAIVLAVGLVVDDAIVVVENVERNIGEGKTPFKAAIVGARELVGPIIAGDTITLAAVYAPIGFQGGLTGSLFREFAFTLAGAVFISGFVALTLSPMMSSKLLRSHTKAGWLTRAIDAGFAFVKRSYDRALGATLNARPAVYIVWIVLSLLVMPLYLFSPQELAPNEDQGVSSARSTSPRTATLASSSTPTSPRVEKTFRSVPGVRARLPAHVPGERLRRDAREAVRSGSEVHLPRPGGARTCKLAGMTGGARAGLPPVRAPQPGPLPDRVRDRVDGEPRGARRLRAAARAGRGEERAVRLPAVHGREARRRENGRRPRPRQARVDGAHPPAGRPRSLLDDGRELRQPLRHRRSRRTR